MYERHHCMHTSIYYDECSTNSRGRYCINERQHCMNTSLHCKECSNNTRGRHHMYDKQHFMNTSLYCEVCSNNFRVRYDVTWRKDNTSWILHCETNRIRGVIVTASSVVDRVFEPRSGQTQTKDYKIDICCLSASHAAFRRKSKDCLTRNQDNVSAWTNMSIRGLLFQWVSTKKIKISVLVEYKADLIIISLKINLFSLWYSWKTAALALINRPLTHSLKLKLSAE